MWQCRRQEFDVILMDVQMPVMDGFQTTAAIRALPNSDGASATVPDVPIIAVTGYAMADDRAHCLEMGMDAFIAKPIDVGPMLATIERMARRFRERRGIRPSEQVKRIRVIGVAEDPARKSALADDDGDGEGCPVDLEASLTRMAGDRELLDEMVGLFREDAPALLARIEKSLESSQPNELERAAHSLKGLCANLESKRAAAAANALLEAARAGDLALARDLVPEMQRQIRRVLEWF